MAPDAVHADGKEEELPLSDLGFRAHNKSDAQSVTPSVSGQGSQSLASVPLLKGLEVPGLLSSMR